MRMQHGARILAGLALGLWLAAGGALGCSYARDRALDFTDIVQVGVSDGGGIIVRAVPTRFLTLELGGRKDETFYGIRRRSFHWVESSWGLLFSSFWSPRIGEEAFARRTGTDVIRTSHSKLLFPLAERPEALRGEYEEHAYHLFVLTRSQRTHLVEYLDLEADVSLLIVGAQVIVSPGELLDFLAGLITLDPAGDDGKPTESSEKES